MCGRVSPAVMTSVNIDLSRCVFCSCRDWTGDLKKLPNIKLRRVSNRDLSTNDAEEKGHEAEDCNEDDEEDLEDEDESMSNAD